MMWNKSRMASAKVAEHIAWKEFTERITGNNFDYTTFCIIANLAAVLAGDFAPYGRDGRHGYRNCGVPLPTMLDVYPERAVEVDEFQARRQEAWKGYVW